MKAARWKVEDALGMDHGIPPEIYRWDEPRGAFVTINTFPTRQLRGCIGRPYPSQPLWKAVLDSAMDAAFHDPRFPPLSRAEIDHVVFEVSILTMPQLISGPIEERPHKIEVGRHGLILKSGWTAGLLLPQVAVEYKMGPVEFLDALCEKAGLFPGCWKRGDVDIYTFEADIWEEESPRGPVVHKTLKG